MADLLTRLRLALADRYTIERELGSGGMATVYLAQDLKHHRQVAIKLLKPELAAALGPARFLREIATAAGLSHPHILPLHASGDVAGFLYYVMPFVEGESLRSRLDRERQLPLADALQITREVADALGYAHSRDVVHRDIKPDNILLSSGHALVADFGIARAISAAGGDSMTETGIAVGTPGYMSPEQATGERHLDGRSDLYSLACVLYEMLVGEPPFTGPSVQAVLARHSLDPVPPLRTVRATVPEAVERAITQALAKVPADRFVTAFQFVEALSAPGPSAGRAGGGGREGGGENAIVVFDFKNISGDPALNWLCSGIAETVSVDLKKVAGLKIISRDKALRALATRSEQAITDSDVSELGRALGARWVVWGGFQSSGNLIRITPQFAQTDTGELISAAKIDGRMEDIFALQDRIVTTLMEILNVEVSHHELQKIGKAETDQLKAYECYAKGRQLFRQFGKTSFEQAAQYFQQAIAIDPEYANAYSGLGSVFAFRYIARTRREDLEVAIAHLERALALDPDLVEPYQWLAYAYMREYRFDEGERAAIRATELDPDGTFAHYFLGCNYIVRAAIEHEWQWFAKAVPSLVRSIELEFNYHPSHLGLGWVYLLNGQYDLARALLDHTVRLEQTGEFKEVKFVGGLTLRGGLSLRENRLDDAAELFKRALDLYTAADHVYAEAFTALTHCGLGEIGIRRGTYDIALEHYTRAREICASNPQKLGIGYIAVKARLGLATVFQKLAMRREEAAHFQAAADLFSQKQGCDFNWMWEGSDAQACYDFARYHAASGRRKEAVASLWQAVESGWGDVPQLTLEETFGPYQADPELDAVRRAVAARGRIPEYPADLFSRVRV